MDDQAVTFAKLAPSNSRFQRLRAELGLSGFGMNLITLQPGQRGRIHAHERQEEVYLVLEGQLGLGVEGEHHTLGRYDVVRIAPHVRRQLANVSPEPVVILAMGASGTHLDSGKDGRAWESWDDHGPGRPTADVPMPDDIDLA
ncbi:MAG: cupin domain-containing protein [Solirubrobacteraceae bacterium]|nr:cupin domain-containing protein [Patulibacter sp.]